MLLLNLLNSWLKLFALEQVLSGVADGSLLAVAWEGSLVLVHLVEEIADGCETDDDV